MSPKRGSKRGENGWRLPPEAVSLIKRAIVLSGRTRVAREARLQDRTLRRAMEGHPCSSETYERAVQYAADVLTSAARLAFRVTEGS